MKTYPRTLIALLVGTTTLFGCDAVSDQPVEPSAESAVSSSARSPQIAAKATGGGQYSLSLLGEAFPGKVSFSAIEFADGDAAGQFHIELDLLDGIPDAIDGGVAAFKGRVTCVSSDTENGRAWIGGVVTQNRSTQPFYRDDPTTQVGKDIWFRVLDAGEGQRATDRTTFAGFEGGGGIITSQEYCDAQIWPDGNARTHQVRGNIQVHE